MAGVPVDKENKCPKCGFRQPPGDICISCGLVFAKYRPPVSTWVVNAPPENAGPPEVAEPATATTAITATVATVATVTPAATATVDSDDWEPVSKVNIINIIALLFLVDSTLSLLGRVPALSGVFASSMSFHEKAKHLYDVIMQLCVFVSVFGLLMRKEWARISMIVLLALGLAEGLYMLLYLHVTVTGLEKEMHENLSELKQNNTAKWIGCAVYAYFIAVLCSTKVKCWFQRCSSSSG